jgi:hypothetical protein
MTPPRLVELCCPQCQRAHWTIDFDFRAAYLAGGIDVSYGERPYMCPHCKNVGTGHVVLRKSPTEFFLQPHPMYPMKRAEFDQWVATLRQNFPDHPKLRNLNRTWYPYAPNLRWHLGRFFRFVSASYPGRLARRFVEEIHHRVDMHRERSRRQRAARAR